MIGFFFCLNGIISTMAAPFGAGVSAASSIAAQRAQLRAAVAARSKAQPKTVWAATIIPKVTRRAKKV